MAKKTRIIKLANGNVSVERDAQKYRFANSAVVKLFSKDAVIIYDGANNIVINYNEVVTPVCNSGADLYNQLIEDFFLT